MTDGDLDCAALARRFWAEGYVAIDGFFPPDVARASHDWLLGAGAEAPVWAPVEGAAVLQTDLAISIVLCADLAPSIQRLHGDARLRALTGAILGANYEDLYAMLMRFTERGAGGPWHQDCSS